MARTVADFIVERLVAWEVRHVFGYAGDGINGILGALRRAGDGPRWIQPAHEELAALMACAYAKFSGDIGVCMATSGPGAIHLLNGLYDANLDHQPVVAIVGQQARMSLGGHFQQDVDLMALLKDVAGDYLQMATSPAQVRHLIDQAFRIARARRSVTCVIVPHDLQSEPAVESPPHEHGALHSGIGAATPLIVPRPRDLQRAAAVLNEGRRVALLVGAGALHAGSEVAAVAERLGAGVAKALLGKAALPDDLPFVTGTAGWLGTGASNRMLASCDTLLMVGSSFPYAQFLPEEGRARGVQIDVDARMLSLRYPMEVELVGDAAATLAALLPLLEEKQDGAWRDAIADWIAAARRTEEEDAQRAAEPLNPRRVFFDLSPRLPENAILTGDSGSSTVWYARYLKTGPGMLASLSGTLATMGSALPYAHAAKIAHPDRPVFAFSGDGALQMIGLNALIGIAREWRSWSDPRLVVLVLNNRDLNYVTWEQRVMEGDPRFDASQDVPDFPYAAYAEMLGLRGIRVARPEDVAAAWDQALAADRPVLVEAVTDPNVPSLPPELTGEQKDKLRGALREGDSGGAALRRHLHAEYLTGDAE
jgi:pyruvate dehydrogenase (quinone)